MTGPDPQRQFVAVPVPSEYVTHVMAYIGLLDGHGQPTVGPDPGSVEEALAAEEVADADTADQQWSVEDLRRLARGNTITTQVLTDILDVLAAQPGTWMTSVELAAETNRDAETIKRIWTHVGRHLNKRYAGLPWPLHSRWGPNFEPARHSVVYNTVDDEQALLRVAARSEDAA